MQGFATFAVNGTYRLYEIAILTGKAIDRGGYFRNIEVFDIALPFDQSVATQALTELTYS